VSAAGATYFGAKVTLQLGHSARPLQQIIAKVPATEEQASSASRTGSTSWAALRTWQSVRYRTDTTASQDPLSICIFSVAAVADGLPTGLGASVAQDWS
jgi:hypothetical protein